MNNNELSVNLQSIDIYNLSKTEYNYLVELMSDFSGLKNSYGLIPACIAKIIYIFSPQCLLKQYIKFYEKKKIEMLTIFDNYIQF